MFDKIIAFFMSIIAFFMGLFSAGGGNGGGTGCATALIVLAIIGWLLCLIGK